MDKISEGVKKLKKRKLMGLLPVMLLAALALLAVIYFGGLMNQKPEVRTSSLERGDISRVMYVTAEIQPGATFEETIPYQQRVTAVHVEPGDQVEKGEVLMTLDTGELQDQYQKAKGAREEMEASTARAEAAAEKQVRERERDMRELENQVELFFESLSETTMKLATLRSISPTSLKTDQELTTDFSELLAEYDPKAEDAREQMEVMLDTLLQGIEVTDNPQYNDILNDLEKDLANLSTSLSRVLTGLTDGVFSDGLTGSILLSPDLAGQLGGLGGTFPDPLAQAKLQEELARERLEGAVTQLKASRPGIIGEVNGEVGSYIGTSPAQASNSLDSFINEALEEALKGVPGREFPGASKPVVIYDNTKPKAVFQANPLDANRLELGMPVIYEYFGETYRGVITRKAPFATSSAFGTGGANDFFGEFPGIEGLPGEPKLEIEMSIEGDQLTDLVLGFFLEAEIVTESAEKVLLLPAEAMRRELDTYYVFVIDKESRLSKREFEQGIQSDMFVEVVSGLTIEDRVVLNPTGDLKEGMLVRETGTGEQG